MLPREQRVAAKVLHHLGWGSRRIEAWLGISDTSVLRAAKEPTPEDLKQFEAEFTLAIQDAKWQGIALVHQQLLKLIPRTGRIDQLVKVGEFFEGKGMRRSEEAGGSRERPSTTTRA